MMVPTLFSSPNPEMSQPSRSRGVVVNGEVVGPYRASLVVVVVLVMMMLVVLVVLVLVMLEG